jgi:hypothetical protein
VSYDELIAAVWERCYVRQLHCTQAMMLVSSRICPHVGVGAAISERP